VGCDGRHSTVCARAGFKADDLGAPMDVLWFRLPKKVNDPDETMGRFEVGRIVVILDRGDYWQCAFLIRKGSIEETKRAGLPAFRRSVAQIVPAFADRVDDLKDWDQIKLLTVAVNSLRRWHRPGLLCIGDAAHATSPIGGVGVNLGCKTRWRRPTSCGSRSRPARCARTTSSGWRRRREFPTRVTQRIQVVVQNNVIDRLLGAGEALAPPWPLRLTSWFAPLRLIPAWLVGKGVRPEHVHTPDIRAAAR